MGVEGKKGGKKLIENVENKKTQSVNKDETTRVKAVLKQVPSIQPKKRIEPKPIVTIPIVPEIKMFEFILS